MVRTESGIDHDATMQGAHKVWFGDMGEDQAGLEEVEDLAHLKAHEHLRRQIAHDVEVFLSTDETDLRPLAVVINSTITNARYSMVVLFTHSQALFVGSGSLPPVPLIATSAGRSSRVNAAIFSSQPVRFVCRLVHCYVER